MSEPRPTPLPSTRSSSLIRYLAIAYFGAVVHASLYPFVGWRAPVDHPAAFVLANWPYYVTYSDLILNTLAYLPAGFLLALIFMQRMPRAAAAFAAISCSALFSLLIELLQAYLPARIPSNLDLITNTSGAILGAAVAGWPGKRWGESGNFFSLRILFFRQGNRVDLGVVLLAAWLLTQLNAGTWLFGNGEILRLLPENAGFAYSSSTYRYYEAAVAALGFAGVAFMTTAIARSTKIAAIAIAVLMMLALSLKSAASSSLYVSGNPLLWITPGSIAGLATGAGIWLLFCRAPPLRLAQVSAACILLGLVAVNLVPENPYLAATLKVWRHGHYASIDGLTHLLSVIWPFFALAYLFVLIRRGVSETVAEQPTETS